MKKAIFLDRDNMLPEDVGFLTLVTETIFDDNVYATLKIPKKDFLHFIITNQSCISKGNFSIKEVNKVNQAVIKRFNQESINITDINICSHSKECKCTSQKLKVYYIIEAEKTSILIYTF